MSNGRSNGGDGSILAFPKLPKLFGDGVSGLRWLLVGALLLFLGFGSVYTIKPEEIGIILRLGKYRGTDTDAGPGLHFKLPVIDRVLKVPVERQLKEEFGFRTEQVGVRSAFSSVPDEANMLSGDLNIAVVEWVVQYRIVDAYKYLFRVRNVRTTFRDMSEAVMRKVVGDRTVNEVLTTGRAEIEDTVEIELQLLADQYETGIRVDEVLLQSNNPPDPVKPSFNEVNQAEQDLERLINEAQAQYNRIIPRAEGEAHQTIEQSEGYALDRVNRALGDAARFEAVYAEYRKAPQVTRTRLYLETMNEILPRVGLKIVVDESIEGLMPLINLDQATGASPAAVAAARRAEGEQ